MSQRNIRTSLSILWIVFFFALNVPSPPVYASPQMPAASPVVDLPQGVVRVTAVEGITEYKWPNGLRVLLFPDPSKDTITVNIT